MTAVVYYPGYSQVQVADNLTWQVIASITNAFPAILNTINDNNYVPGMNVTFNIPNRFGMTQLNGLNVQVLAVNGTQLTLNIDTRSFTPFAYPGSLPTNFTFPTVIPNSSGPYLPPQPLPYGNQDSFEGTIFNAGQI